MVAARFRFKSVRFYVQRDIRSFLPAYAIHLPTTTLLYSIFILFPPCLLSFQDSRTLGRLISSQIIKALQPGLVVHPVLDLFWDAIVCCVITSFVSSSITAHAWS